MQTNRGLTHRAEIAFKSGKTRHVEYIASQMNSGAVLFALNSDGDTLIVPLDAIESVDTVAPAALMGSA